MPELTTQARKQTKAGRFYDIPEIGLLPSVTNILGVINKPALMNWAAKVERELVVSTAADLYEDIKGTPQMSRPAYLLTLGNRLGKAKASQKELARASEIGTMAHNLIEWTLKGELCLDAGPAPRIVDAAQWAFMAWEDWRKSVNMKPIRVEQVIWSERYGYAGTLDLLAEINGKLSVVDWKTGKAVYTEAHLQNAAYRQAVREMGHGNPVKGYIVRLPKVETDPQFEVVEAEDEDASFDVFRAAKELWKWAQAKEAEYEAKRDAAA